MSKKITSLFLALVLVLGMMVSAIPVSAADADSSSLTITASKTEVNPGDTITFTVTMGPIVNLHTLQFEMKLPEGLTYVKDSADVSRAVAAFQEYNSKADVSFDPQYLRVFSAAIGIKDEEAGKMVGFSSDSDIVLLTFDCTVGDSLGTKTVTTKEDMENNDPNVAFFFARPDQSFIEMNITPATFNVVCAHVNQTKEDDLQATCTEGGYIGATVCDDCGVTLIEKEKIPATGHDYKVVIEKEPTADEDGIMHKECKVCGDKTESEPFKCLHENTSNVPAKEATCEEAGHGAYTVCDECGAVVDGSDAEIPALGHDYGDLIEQIPPTCGKDGVAAHYICARCDKIFNSDKEEITKAELVISATGDHTYIEEWSKDSTYHWHECTVCHKAAANKDKEYHKYAGGVCVVCGMAEPPAPVVVTYTIKAEASEGGSISPAGTTTIVANNDKTYTFTPDKDYVIADVLVDGKSVGAVDSYKFSGVKGNHTISVVFKWAKFVDVAVNDRYYNAIKYVYQNNLFIGTSDTEFSPNMTMDRAMFATVLCRLAGVTPAEVTKSSFSDAVDGAWYVPYIEWAASEGLMLGYGDGKFGVADPITIEQAASIMTRYAEYTGIDVSSDFAFDSYSDADAISEWAVEQMKWVVENGIYIGEGNKLNPADLAKRCQVADIINLYAERFVK